MFNAGFLGMDNISCVDRSSPPSGTSIDQVRCVSVSVSDVTVCYLMGERLLWTMCVTQVS